MIARLTARMLTEPAPGPLWAFSRNFLWKGGRAIRAFERRLARGEYFPAFPFFSITDACNLACQGCWITPSSPPRELSVEQLDAMIRESKAHDCSFFGLLGGEPLLHRGLLDLIGRHPDCYFILFTNGTLLTDDVAAALRRLRNVSPLVSVEGLERVSDERRGARDVYRRTMAGLDNCRRHRLVTGVATSVCRSNIDELATDRFLEELIRRRVHFVWYYIYRPLGARPCPELCLSAEQVTRLRRFLVEARSRFPILIVDAYWDHLGRALCPAAVGISHHIGPGGDIEPCPAVQFAGESAGAGPGFYATVAGSPFLREFRDLARRETRGCILMERPDLLAALARRQGAHGTSGRGTELRELDQLAPCPSHAIEGQEIPEQHWLYKAGKKNWFFGFGAYG